MTNKELAAILIERAEAARRHLNVAAADDLLQAVRVLRRLADTQEG